MRALNSIVRSSTLAVAAMEAGERVFMLDMDAQRSLMNWAQMRGRGTGSPVEAVTAGRLAPTLAALEKNGFTLAIIDTPGVEGAASIAAMKAADLNIIPVRPNVFDLRASEATRKALKEHRAAFAFALNQCPPAQQTARVQQGTEALEAMGGPDHSADPLTRRLPRGCPRRARCHRVAPVRRGGR